MLNVTFGTDFKLISWMRRKQYKCMCLGDINHIDSVAFRH